MKIDVHAHYFPSEYMDLLERYGAADVTSIVRKMKFDAPGLAGLAEHLRQMDGSGVDLQVLSVSGQLPYFARESDAVDAARFANDIYARVVREYPKRFAAFACTPLPHVGAAIEETRRALDDLGMVGVTVGTFVLGKSIADPAFDEFFAELNRRKAVVLIHPLGDGLGSPWLESGNLVWAVGAPLEDTICLLHFMQADFPRRFPDLKIIVPHLGGIAPFLSERLDRQKAAFLPQSAALPSAQAKYFWYDTVNGNPWALRGSVETLGADHMLMGTDYPFWRGDAFKLCVDYVGNSGLVPNDVESIFEGNPRKLLRL